MHPVLNKLNSAAGSDYIGEPVSQLEHALQAAELAVSSKAAEAQVLAALLHDIGHINESAEQMAGLGVLHHERLGAEYLLQQSVAPAVAALVALHVDAKRYLCSRPGYADKLSEASIGTLAYQGGGMSPEEARRFEEHPLFKAALQLRAWDDAAKVPEKSVPPLSHYESMLKRHLTTSPELVQQWQTEGFVHLPGWYSADEMQVVDQVTTKLQKLPETPGHWMQYFETVDNQRQLCRIENFLQYEPVFREIAEGSAVSTLLEVLLGEPAVIFKEKINFKLPGGQGFAPHQDAPAFASFDQSYHLTVMVSIDASTRANGCLEIADRPTGPNRLLAMKQDLTLTDEYTLAQSWRPIETSPGDLVIFDAYLPHRSGPNTTNNPRRALYSTYNLASEGNFRDAYFQAKREAFPPDVEREPGKQYDAGLFNVGNPVDLYE